MATIEELESLRWDLRRDCVDIIMAGAGGHIGGDMSVIDALMTLYANHLNISPETVDDPNRDRFVLSKGHAMEAYYAVLCHEGYLDLDDVKARFSSRRMRSISACSLTTLGTLRAPTMSRRIKRE